MWKLFMTIIKLILNELMLTRNHIRLTKILTRTVPSHARLNMGYKESLYWYPWLSCGVTISSLFHQSWCPSVSLVSLMKLCMEPLGPLGPVVTFSFLSSWVLDLGHTSAKYMQCCMEVLGTFVCSCVFIDFFLFLLDQLLLNPNKG